MMVVFIGIFLGWFIGAVLTMLALKRLDIGTNFNDSSDTGCGCLLTLLSWGGLVIIGMIALYVYIMDTDDE